MPVMAFLGFVIGVYCFRRFSANAFALGAIIGVIAANIFWVLGGYVVDAMKLFWRCKRFRPVTWAALC